MPHVTALSGVRSTPRFVEVETPRSRSKLQCEVGETGVLPLGKEPCMFFPRAVQWGIWLSDTTCHQVCMPTKITVAVTAFRGHLCGGTGHWDRCPSEKCVCSQSHQCGNLLKPAPVPSGSMLMMRLLWWTSILCLVCTPTHILGHIPYPLVCLWRAKNKSSTQVCFLKPEFQHSVAANTSRYASQAGKCRDLARTIFAGLSLYTEGPQASFYTLHLSLWSSLSVPEGLPSSEGSSQGNGNFLSHLPPRGSGPTPIPLLHPFPFVLPSDMGLFLEALLYEMFWKLSVGILWELFHMQLYT